MGNILIIDDDVDLAEATARVLRAEGHAVAVHLDAETAFEKFKLDRPDLVILDVMFPGNSSGGFDLAGRSPKRPERSPS